MRPSNSHAPADLGTNARSRGRRRPTSDSNHRNLKLVNVFLRHLTLNSVFAMIVAGLARYGLRRRFLAARGEKVWNPLRLRFGTKMLLSIRCTFAPCTTAMTTASALFPAWRQN